MRSDAKKSVLWSGIQSVANQGIHFIITLIIARILTPEDYGLVAMLTIFYALAQAFINSGLTGALIQKKDCNEKDFNSVLVFGLVVSILLYSILFFCAPFIANLYHNELLIDLSRVYLFCLVINSIGIVPQTIMQKNLQFKELAYINLSVELFSGVATIILAYMGWAYWALVFQIMITSLITTIAYSIVIKWKPTFRFSMSSLKSMISYGFPVMLTSIVNAIYNNIYSLVIGAKYNSKQLGLYNRAYSYASTVPINFSNFSMRAMFPVLARIQDNHEELKMKALDMLHMSLYVVVPINLYIIFNSEDIIVLSIGSKWLELGPYLQILCVACISYVYTNIHATVLKTIGATKTLFVSETIRKIIGIIVLVFTVAYGVMVMVYGMLVYALLDVTISSILLKSNISVGLKEQIKASFTPFAYALLSGLVNYMISLALPNLYLRFAICTLVFGCTYYLLSTFFKEKGLLFLKNYFK